jgi:hypothetical protein
LFCRLKNVSGNDYILSEVPIFHFNYYQKQKSIIQMESKEMGEEVLVVVLRQIRVQLFGGKLSPCSYLIN